MSDTLNSYYQQIAVLTGAVAAMATSIATWWNAYSSHSRAGEGSQAQYCFQQYQICERDKADKEAQIRDLQWKIRDLESKLNRH
ncbi:uncharacterized protein FFB20_12150 [Fusarium fujikuroi]|nr:uncharacterized protein FFE2_00194 [Fusarium fujikuroi]SCN68899.1 uncharacterized protein FFC1_00190 [Fusarium fujikuroi]SCN71491.1 uncharacterized protein FFM5_00161 [Fusarium fujikuroi]SCO04631.1 uncharacterized protein FFB20_12150 [Fusarium fujikuroi]SCO28202.1 uncharacterized protein FFNC_00193 [Fusarium fujikuroi]